MSFRTQSNPCWFGYCPPTNGSDPSGGGSGGDTPTGEGVDPWQAVSMGLGLTLLGSATYITGVVAIRCWCVTIFYHHWTTQHNTHCVIPCCFSRWARRLTRSCIGCAARCLMPVVLSRCVRCCCCLCDKELQEEEDSEGGEGSGDTEVAEAEQQVHGGEEEEEDDDEILAVHDPPEVVVVAPPSADFVPPAVVAVAAVSLAARAQAHLARILNPRSSF